MYIYILTFTCIGMYKGTEKKIEYIYIYIYHIYIHVVLSGVN